LCEYRRSEEREEQIRGQQKTGFCFHNAGDDTTAAIVRGKLGAPNSRLGGATYNGLRTRRGFQIEVG
jgi:hypothetical protein